MKEVDNQLEHLQADKTNMELQRDLAQDKTEKEQFEEQLKEWAVHNAEAQKVREETEAVKGELKKAATESALALKIARDLAAGKADEVKKAAGAIAANAKKALAKADANVETLGAKVSKFASRMSYLEKVADTTTSEKVKAKNEKAMAKLQPELDKAKRAFDGAAKFAEKTRETRRNALMAVQRADETLNNKSKLAADLYKEATARMSAYQENAEAEGDQADKLLNIKRAMEDKIKAEKARKRKEAAEREAKERIEKARAEADEAKVLKQ